MSGLNKQGSRYLKSNQCITKSCDELECEIGISSMCIYPGDTISGITNMTYRRSVPLIVLQALILQWGLLYFLSSLLVPRAELHKDFEPLPHSIVFIAIYLHFLNCMQELPYSWQLFHHLPDLHTNLPDLFLFGGVIILDGFVVPLVSFTLGALYLCTSRTIGDVILNAVAVAFIHDIDNWILGLNTRANLLAGKVSVRTIHIPINRPAMRQFVWSVVYIPVVPILMSSSFCFIGFQVLKL